MTRVGTAKLAILAWALIVGVLHAELGDSLQTWPDLALDQNQEIQVARHKWEAARQGVARARSFDDPMFGVDFMRMDSTGFDDYDETEYMVSQRLPWPGKRRARMNVAELEAQAEGFRYLEVMRTVRAQVTQAYWSLWEAGRAFEINRENRDLLASFAKIAQARYESGAGLQAEVLKAQVELAELENQLETLRSEQEVAEARINRLLSLPAGTRHYAATDPSMPVLRWTLDESYSAARLYCCILLSYLIEAEARERAVREARLEGRPDIEFRVAARQQRSRNSIYEYDTGVAINIPWLWRGKYRAGVREAEAAHASALAEFQNEVDMTFLEVKKYHSAADTAHRTLHLYDNTILPRTRELLESTRAAYENGETGFLDLIDAQRQWATARLGEARTRSTFARRMADLSALVEPWQDYEIETGLISEDMRHGL